MEASSVNLVPCLPENAPFTLEQRAYLNGFLAGIFSRQPARNPVGDAPLSAPQLISLAILFGSQTGTAEALAKRLAKEAGKRGFAPTVQDLSSYPAKQIASEGAVLIITSTYGDGDPPDNAKSFWDFLNSPAAPQLGGTRFSICALGDTNYAKFCQFGKDLDARLKALQAVCVCPTTLCDTDYEAPFSEWMSGALNAMRETAVMPAAGATLASPITAESALKTQASPPASDRNRPLPAQLVSSRRLNSDSSEKDVRHFEISLGDGVVYQAGDALGVYAMNCPELVDDLIRALKFSGAELVIGRENTEVPLREALLTHYEITKVPQNLLRFVAERSQETSLGRLLSPEANGELAKYLWGRDVADVLLEHPGLNFTPAEFVALLKKCAPRLYSISSSLKAHPGQAHLTVNVLRYEALGRRRKGVCSTYLAERSRPADAIPIFIQPNQSFRLPSNPDAPVIMVGPGTGIAPFRAFLQERRALGAKGKNWLFFGEQRADWDFLYREELEAMRRDGFLTRLDTAFSRDQAEKVYVQHRLRDAANEVFEWLEAGAHFYVCGDAKRMASDVDAALHRVVETAGSKTPEQSAEYIRNLRQQNRYSRDVY